MEVFMMAMTVIAVLSVSLNVWIALWLRDTIEDFQMACEFASRYRRRLLELVTDEKEREKLKEAPFSSEEEPWT